MSGPRPKAPGWYPDPDILPGSTSVLRYWNGRHWTDQRRPMPVLATLDLDNPARIGMPQPRAIEGPARAAELPAPAAEVSATRDAAAGRTETTERPPKSGARSIELPTAAGGGRGTPPEPPQVGGGGDDGDGGDEGTPARSATTRKRRKWWLIAAVAVVAALAVIWVGEAMRPPSPGPRVLTDRQFVRLANADCAKTMPNLRPPVGGPLGSSVSAAAAATQIDQAATGLDALADRLVLIPAAEPDRPHIKSWLDGWHSYDAIGHQYADHLRVHGTTTKAPDILKTATGIAKNVDNFARANGLSDCLFAFVYRPDPSQM